jgi:glycosyltransferase involved in cell wall biosynthesis
MSLSDGNHVGARRIRIVHLISGLGVGGAELTLQSLVRDLEKRGHVSIIISLSELGEIGKELRASGYQVIALGWRSNTFPPLGFLHLVRRIRKLKPNILQTWMYHADFVGALVALVSPGLRLIWNVRGTGVDRYDLPWRTRLLIRVNAWLSRIPNAVVFNSRRGHSAHRQLGYHMKSSEVIVNGIQGDRFIFDIEAGQRIRQELNLPGHVLLLGTVGRYHPVKGFDLLIQAFSMVAKDHSEIHLVMIGKDLVPQNNELALLIDQEGLIDRVKFVGVQSNLNGWYSAMDAFVLSSLSEGFPNVVVEAMACQTPCIVTDVGDSAEIVGQLGMITNPGDVVSLAKAIRSIIALSPQERTVRGTSSRQRVLELFSFDVMVDRYENLYLEVTQAGS